MVVRGWLDGTPIALSLKPGALTVALGEGPVIAFDRAGRLWSFSVAGHHFRRALNGAVLSKWREAGLRQRRRLSQNEADLLLFRASLIASELRDRLQIESSRRGAPHRASESRIRQVLARAARFDVRSAHADVERYHKVYKPIGILPPDQYLALVLQVTEGCSFNSCTFCSFYKGRPFRVKSPTELREHIHAVREHLGDALPLRRGVFLADANALVVSQKRLIALLDVINEEFGASRQLSAFLDGFSGRKKSVEDYAALARRGLRRVYVGLESGHDPLLAWVRKPGRSADVVEAVRRMKQGGVHVGVIVLLGIGGEGYSEGHVQDTIAAVNEMGLGQGDLLYFSQFIPAGTLYDVRVTAQHLRPLPPPAMQAQKERILGGLTFGNGQPQVAAYDIREFMY